LILLGFCLISFAFVALRSGCFWCDECVPSEKRMLFRAVSGFALTLQRYNSVAD
jgi:hypothetical protein